MSYAFGVPNAWILCTLKFMGGLSMERLRNRFSVIVFSLVVLLGLNGCDGVGSGAAVLPFNPNVAAFTSGTISRFADVKLFFENAIPESKRDVKFINDVMGIKPHVDGSWSIEGDRCVVFKPRESFDRSTKYTVSAKLDKIFDDCKGEKPFRFGVETMPLSFDADVSSLDCAEDADVYDVTVSIKTPDKEDASLVESLITSSEDVETQWSHDPNGTDHTLVLKNVKSDSKARNVALNVASNGEGAPSGELMNVEIPAENDFSVYDISYVEGKSGAVEITFTKQLDKSLDYEGLAAIMDGDAVMEVNGNKIRLFPDDNSVDKVTVRLDAAIKSVGGERLGENLTFEVDVRPLKPSVSFVDDGVIVPQSEKTLIPFTAAYLRGVQVRVIKIYGDNMGQFLQSGDLDSESEIMRVGRLMAIKTVMLGEPDDPELKKRKVYALDLTEMIKPETGAVYRVILCFDRDLSVYDRCTENREYRTAEQIEADDKALFLKESSRFDANGSYYYTYRDWSRYRYSESEDPCSDSYYMDYGAGVGKNVFVTDIALTAKADYDNRLHVMARRITDTNPINGLEVTAFDYQRRNVGEGVTDDKGNVVISCSRKPFYLVAEEGKMRAYVRVDEASSLSLSSFDVSGQSLADGMKGFIYGERGVWRPGDTLHVGFMLNDREKKIPQGMPVTAELYMPQGQLFAKETASNDKFGMTAFDFPLGVDVPTGSWNVKVNVGGAVFEKRMRVETVKPNRLKIKLASYGNTISADSLITISSEWMHGAKADGLGYRVECLLGMFDKPFKGYEAYSFSDVTKKVSQGRYKVAEGTLDAQGVARFRFGVNIVASDAPGMMKAAFTSRVYEKSGDFSTAVDVMTYSPFDGYVGLKTPGDGNLETGKQHPFSVVALSPDGQPRNGAAVKVKVSRLEGYWWWYSDDDYFSRYKSAEYRKPIETKDVTVGADGKAEFSLGYPSGQWGYYLIEVKDVHSGHVASRVVYFGESWRASGEGEYANLLQIKSDKTFYVCGDSIAVSFPSSVGARAIISIENGSGVLSVYDHKCTSDYTEIKIKATEQMQPTVYVGVSLIQPYGVRNDRPIRMYGVVPVEVTDPASRLEPVIKSADKIRPESDFTVTVAEKKGRAMGYTIAIVDEGLLDLTRFATPDPFAAFNAREALGVRTWDNYNHIIGAYGGRIGRILSIGGDDALLAGSGSEINRFAPVVIFEGPFELKAGETKRHTFKMPNYNGRVKVMVVASDGKAFGNADKSVLVRKPVMLLGTMPRVIGVGDRMAVPATVFVTEKGFGTVNLKIECSDNLEVVGSNSSTVTFSGTGEKVVPFTVKARNTEGEGRVRITAVSGAEKAVYEATINIRAVKTEQTAVSSLMIEAGKSAELNVNVPGESGKGTLTLELSSVEPLDLSGRMRYLIGYPHGCIEQTVSKAFPQIYLPKVTEMSSKQAQECQYNVEAAIGRLRSYSLRDGSFSYWPGGLYGDEWGTAYALHFLTEAKKAGYDVPDFLFNNALKNVARVSSDWTTTKNTTRSSLRTQAYRLYLLALNNKADKGAMNRLRECGMMTPSVQNLLAAAYVAIGRKDVASQLMERTADISENYYDDTTYGSPLRDRAIALIAATAVGNIQNGMVLSKEISEELSSSRVLSTQEVAYALMALSGYQLGAGKDSAGIEASYSCQSVKGNVSTTKYSWYSVLSDKAPSKSVVSVVNKGKSPLYARLVGTGVLYNEKVGASSNGLRLNVVYKDADGNEIDVTRLNSGVDFYCHAIIENVSGRSVRNIALTQIFPAGWEILNQRYVEGGDESSDGVSYRDIRDDRVSSYIDNLPDRRSVTVVTRLSAAYAGCYYLPTATCEAMYDNTLRANTKSGEIEVL